MTAPVIDFTALSARHHILPTTPAWPSVQEAMQRLESHGDHEYKGQKADAGLVDEFAELLRHDSRLIGVALTCAAALGRALESGSRTERIERGLAALNAVYRLEALNQKEKTTTLNRLLAELNAIDAWKELKAPARLPRRAIADNWKSTLHENLELASTAGWPNHQEWQSLSAAAWQSAAERLSNFVTGRTDTGKPTLADLVTHATNALPASLLKLDLGSMTIVDWSKVFLSGLVRAYSGPGTRNRISKRLAHRALAILGFNVSETAEWLQVGSADPSPFDGVGVPAPTHAPICALVIRTGPLLTQWLPDRERPILALTAAEFASANEQLPKGQSLFHALPVQLIAFELPAEPHLLTTTKVVVRKSPSLQLGYIGETDAGMDPTSIHIIAPKKPEDIFLPLRRMTVV
ncbi:MAG: hypothetical protein WEE89_15245 [Gemmatimonadota bacterium]